MADQIMHDPFSLINMSNSTVNQNYELCKELSLQVARKTKSMLIMKIKETFSAEDAALFKVKSSASIDSFGRCSYISFQFLDRTIAVPHSGAFLMRASAKRDS